MTRLERQEQREGVRQRGLLGYYFSRKSHGGSKGQKRSQAREKKAARQWFRHRRRPERAYQQEPLLEPLIIESHVANAMRLAVLDRVLEQQSASATTTCCMLDILMALRGCQEFFDLYTEEPLNFPQARPAIPPRQREHEAQTRKYRLMKALETLSTKPSASTTRIASWEEAKAELSRDDTFLFVAGEEDAENQQQQQLQSKPTSAFEAMLNLAREQRRDKRSITQKLNQLTKATISKRLYLHDDLNLDDKDFAGRTGLDENDEAVDNISDEDIRKQQQLLRLEDAEQQSKAARREESLQQLDAADRAFMLRLWAEQERTEARRKPARVVQAEHKREQARLQAAKEEAARQAEAQRRASLLMRPFSADEQARIRQALHEIGPPDQVIAQVGADSVQRESLQRLQPGQWLNDEVIHFFLTVLSRRDEEMCAQADPSKRRRRSHFYKSFFVSKLLNEGHSNPAIDGTYEYKNVKRWSKKVPGKDLFQLDKVFFPINQGGMHWVCAVAYMQERRIQFYDSLGAPGTEYLNFLFRYIQDEHKDKKKQPLPDLDEWQLIECERACPRQLNGYDCGVFTCMFCDFLSKDCPLVFDQKHITQCRERIVLSILNGTAIM